jgi:hypothetical protein
MIQATMLTVVLAAGAAAAPAPAPDGKAALERLKALAGEWQGHMTTEDGPPVALRYEVGSGGTVVKETLFPGSKHEMLSVYHVVGGELVLTHYCAMGNQPRMKMSPASTASDLVFDFDGGTNFDPAKDPHVHSGKITLVAPDRLYAEWHHFAGGKRSGEAKIWISRKK